MSDLKLASRQIRNGTRAILGASPAIATLRHRIERLAGTSAPVLISGPSGSGKEVAARAIHECSGRANGAFVAINCGAIPPELIESELFGHERGSFTGATARRIGRFEQADGGTLFLDEIGDMRFDMQVKLLRVLETGLISRVGGNSEIRVDVRIVSATHQDLETAIAAGRFREDLYFRLCVVPLIVPPLSERAEDIPALIEHFQLRSTATRARFGPGALQHLAAYAWPGNVRELRNVVERANALFPDETITAAKAHALFIGKATRAPEAPVFVKALADEPATVVQMPDARAPAEPIMPIDLKALLETMELERIQMALDTADGVISEAARLLTLKRTTLIEKMRKYGVDKTC